MAKLHNTMATTQEQLALPAERAWKIDGRTREVGRRGIAEARAALHRAASGPEPRSGTRKAA